MLSPTEKNSQDGHDAFLSDVAETSRVLRKLLGTKTGEVPDHFFAYKHQATEALSCYK